MQLFTRFYPDDYIDSIYKMDIDALSQRGILAICFDIDNTLAEHNAPASQSVIDFFKFLHQRGIRTCLMSNNKKERVSSFALQVQSDYIYKANKPSKKAYDKALQILKVSKREMVFVGDQLFTDIWGAKRMGIYSILVKPIHPHEEIQIVIKRWLESIVLREYRRHKICSIPNP